MLNKFIIVCFLCLMHISLGKNTTNSTNTANSTKETAGWLKIICPKGCYVYESENSTSSCVCPAKENSPIVEGCNPSIEVCALVKVVGVDLGF